MKVQEKRGGTKIGPRAGFAGRVTLEKKRGTDKGGAVEAKKGPR